MRRVLGAKGIGYGERRGMGRGRVLGEVEYGEGKGMRWEGKGYGKRKGMRRRWLWGGEENVLRRVWEEFGEGKCRVRERVAGEEEYGEVNNRMGERV